MPYRTILNMVGGAVHTVSEFYEDVTETVRSITPEPIGKALDIGLIWDGYDLNKFLTRIIDIK